MWDRRELGTRDRNLMTRETVVNRYMKYVVDKAIATGAPVRIWRGTGRLHMERMNSDKFFPYQMWGRFRINLISRKMRENRKDLEVKGAVFVLRYANEDKRWGHVYWLKASMSVYRRIGEVYYNTKTDV